jgi:hypothetical protein
LYELIVGQSLVLYPDAGMRLAASRAIAVESARGWRIAKEKQSHKIDVIVALAMSAWAAVQGAGVPLGFMECDGWMSNVVEEPPAKHPPADPAAVSAWCHAIHVASGGRWWR